MKAKILGVAGTIGAFLAMAPKAFAQAITPVPASVPASMQQLAVDGVVSVQEGFFDIIGLVWPYVLVLILGFLAIRFGMRMIWRRGV